MAGDPLTSWDDLRLIQAIAETRGLTGAAEALGLNHSTVFRRLAQIEERIGGKLFERHRAGYEPTAVCEEIVGIARETGDRLDALSLRLSGQGFLPAGELRLTTNDTLFVHLLPPILAGFREAYPDIRIDTLIATQALNLSRRDADVALRATDDPPDNLVGRRVGTIAWALYGRASTWAGKPFDVDVCQQQDWVALGDNLSHLKVSRFVRAHVRPERLALRINTVLGLAEAVEAGIGIGPLPCFIADRRAGLVRLMDPDPDFAAGLWLLTHPDLRHAPRVRAFMDYMAGELGRRRSMLEGARL